MFLTFAHDNLIDLSSVYSVGNSLRRHSSRYRRNGQADFGKTGKGGKTLRDNPQLKLPIFENLHEAAHFIITAS